jgi:hypothetical protein
MSKLFRLALEESSDGKAEKEIEFTYYGQLNDVNEVISNAKSSEAHEQWEIKIPKTDDNAGSGQMRVRKTSDLDGKNVSYKQTTKTKTKDGHRIEIGITTSEDGFKQFSIMSNRGMYKDRYNFPIDGLTIEFDLYYDKKVFDETGKKDYHDWCKIDIELPKTDHHLPDITQLPVSFKQLITSQPEEQSAEEKAKIQELYDTLFLSPNLYLKQ